MHCQPKQALAISLRCLSLTRTRMSGGPPALSAHEIALNRIKHHLWYEIHMYNYAVKKLTHEYKTLNKDDKDVYKTVASIHLRNALEFCTKPCQSPGQDSEYYHMGYFLPFLPRAYVDKHGNNFSVTQDDLKDCTNFFSKAPLDQTSVDTIACQVIQAASLHLFDSLLAILTLDSSTMGKWSCNRRTEQGTHSRSDSLGQ